jgi:peptide/nickel transport system substrate-binding protein
MATHEGKYWRRQLGRTVSSIVLSAALMALGPAALWADEPVKGGTLVMARDADIFTFDPYNTQDDPSIFTELTVYDRLVKLGADGKSVEPELATGWTISADGLSADFTLRDGVKFSDGSPLSTEDVVFSLTRAIDQQSSWGFLFSPVKSVSAVDNHTIRLQMSEPFAPLLPALSTFAASIFSKANCEKWDKAAGEHPLGTGRLHVGGGKRACKWFYRATRTTGRREQAIPRRRRLSRSSATTTPVLQLSSGDLDLMIPVPPKPGGSDHELRRSDLLGARYRRRFRDPEREDQAAGRGPRALRPGPCCRSRVDCQGRLFRSRQAGRFDHAEFDVLLRCGN